MKCFNLTKSSIITWHDISRRTRLIIFETFQVINPAVIHSIIFTLYEKPFCIKMKLEISFSQNYGSVLDIFHLQVLSRILRHHYKHHTHLYLFKSTIEKANVICVAIAFSIRIYIVSAETCRNAVSAYSQVPIHFQLDTQS